MVFSTSPGSTPLTASYHVLNNTDMFRVSSDFWDTWPQLKQQFDYSKSWAVHSVNFPGRWPDLDMLPVGKIGTSSGDAGGERFTRFTPDEQYTLMTLWCISRSPLNISNDLIQNDSFTVKLLTNRVVLDVNQFGSFQKQDFIDKGIVVWESTNVKDQSKYVAIFNHNENREHVQFQLSKLGLAGKFKVRDLWLGKDITSTNDLIKAEVPAHGVILYQLKQEN